MSIERRNQSSTTYSWTEITERLGALAGSIMAKRYIAFVTAARPQDNIPAHILANLLQADYYANAIGLPPANDSSLVFAIDNHGIPGDVGAMQSNTYNGELAHVKGYAAIFRYIYDDQTYNTLMTPEFYLEDLTVELDTRPKLIRYPWEL